MKKTLYSTKNQALCRWLIEQRKQSGLTQRSFANKLGIHHSIVGKIETGERRIDVVELMEYCDVLDANPRDILQKCPVIPYNSIFYQPSQIRNETDLIW